MARLAFILLLTVAALPPATGAEPVWQEYLASLYAGDTEDAEAMEYAYEHLVELEQRPLDINSAQSEDFMLIPGLDLSQISDIMEYRKRYGSMKSIEELGMIPSIDYNLRLFLANFLCVRDTRSRATAIRQELTATAAIPTYYRAGDQHSGSSKYEGRYLGDPVKHSLRYKAAIGERVTLNLTGSKAAAEPFFSQGNSMGYDHYSYNISILPNHGVRKVILGQYRAQFGMGLVMNNGFTLGKQAMLSSVGKTANTLTPHSGTADSRHLQGVAATADFGHWNASAFCSYRYIDATLNDDGTISSILTSNYHRTEKEMEKKHNAAQTTMGGHAGYAFQLRDDVKGGIGLTALYTHLNRALDPVFSKTNTISDAKMYRFFHPRGTDFWNAAADYRLQCGRWRLAGETATGDCHALATINSLSFNASCRLTLAAVQRFYPYQYHSLYSAALSEGGAVQNESGLFLAAKWKPTKPLTIGIYSDMAHFPWKKYLTSEGSHAWDNCASATYSSKEWTLSARYRFKLKQRDLTYTDTQGRKQKQLADRKEHRLRLSAAYAGRRWSAKTQAEGCLFYFDEASKGLIISQSATYKASQNCSVYACGAYFNADDYDARLYTYEHGMRYSFGYSAYYGHGIRAALLMKADFGQHLSAIAKVGHTQYFDRSTIGTAERTIYSSHQTDIDLQLRALF